MKVAGANFDAARTHLAYASITAPFPGYITKRFLDAGANVTSNNAILFTLMDLDEMKITVSVLEKDIPSIAVGKDAVATVDAYPGKSFFGAIRRLSQAVDLSTRTMAVEIEVPNKDHLLKPGMFANITLLVDKHHDAVTIPTQAILKDEKGYFVFVLDSSTAHRKVVVTGIEDNVRTEILTGLSGQERVITTGQQFVKEGGQVTIQQ